MKKFSFNPYGFVKKGYFYLNRYGLKAFLMKLGEKIRYNAHYSSWIKRNEAQESDLALQRHQRFPLEPMISIVVPIFNTPEKFLREMIESIFDQTYSNWELCMVDGGSTQGHVRTVLENFALNDRRIKVKFLRKNEGIAFNTNEAISQATGEFIAFLDHDDILPSFALYEIVKAINGNPDADFIYTDEDRITEDGKKRFDPYFKPDWSPDFLRSCNYIGHLTALKKELLNKIGNLKKEYEGSQDHDLVLRAGEKAKKILHIPKVLYHWRIHRKSVAQDPERKLYAYESARKALREHIKRIGQKGKVEVLPILGLYKTTYQLSKKPYISVIIPSKDNCRLLKKCINSIAEKSSYKLWEIIIVDTGSSDEAVFRYYDYLKDHYAGIKIITWDSPFNYAAVNNYAAHYVNGNILLFLNNDTEVINKDWLERMIEHATRSDVGAVGAKLYYPNRTIQHAGLIVGIEGIAIHLHKFFPKNSSGYFGRLKAIQNLSAITGACLMLRKEVFTEVGGFDERLSLAFNDVDLCLKIREKGYLVVWTPYAELYHIESKTRGYDYTFEKRVRFKRETDLFLNRWSHILTKGDPYYNINVNFKKGDFSIRI
jgi:glycosyltransferase involved in cell wall biosynthesis